MKYTHLLTALLIIFTACGESKKEEAGKLGEKKALLTKLLGEQAKLNQQVNNLQVEIAALAPGEANANAKLVAVDSVRTINFSHYIELQGTIDADNISIVTPRGNPGQVKSVLVRKGDMVRKGQLLLKLDDAIYQQNIRASKESVQTLRTQLNLATELLKRQQNLWDKGIGTEVQLLTAKSNVEALQNQIRSAEEQIKVLDEQLKTTNVYAEVSGIADEVNVRVGEFFQGAVGVTPQIRIVNTSSLKVVTNVPENYIGRVGRGSAVVVTIPDINRTFNSTLGFLSASIDPNSRSFVTEAKLPADGALKPNMIAMVKILDYSAPNAITVPVNVIQTDEKGKYVYVLSREGDKAVARKRAVTIGQAQGSIIEIKGGLVAGEQLITEGFQGLYDGQSITTLLG